MISAVVATYGRLDVLKRTLPTVLEQDLPADEYEVVVVVDGPDPATCDWLRGLSSRVLSIVQQQHLGLAAARNAGLKKAAGETVLLLDNDLVCEPQLLRVHAEAHREVPLIAFGPVLVSSESPRTIASEWVKRASEVRAQRLSTSGPDWPQDVAICANYSAPRQLLLSSGGFDEAFVGACEEFDLGIRLRRKGIEFRYLSAAVVKEFYVKTARDMVRVDSHTRGRNEIRLCRKYSEYGPVSALARFNQGSLITRILRQVAVRVPFPPEILLAPAFRTAEAASGLRVCERIATRLLEFRRSAALFRSAKKEVGSWASFRDEFALKSPVVPDHGVNRSRTGSGVDIAASQ
jgi:GT2 family glycosyltransferase